MNRSVPVAGWSLAIIPNKTVRQEKIELVTADAVRKNPYGIIPAQVPGNFELDMMRAAIEGLTRPDGTRPRLIAVTQLTSIDQARLSGELLIDRPLPEVVSAYAQNARDAGLDGVVCSPLEAGTVHAACGDAFLTVTPGVRFADGATGDQQRVTTPARARELGSDYIVVGRPITASPDPVAAYERCVREFLGE